MSLLFIIPSLLYGWLMISWSGAALGFGLFLASAWTVISRVLPDDIGARYLYPYSNALVEDLHDVRVRAGLSDAELIDADAEDSSPCCGHADPQWEVGRVRCGACNTILLKVGRPDLGRRRVDGFLKGTMRLLLLDGRAMFSDDDKSD